MNTKRLESQEGAVCRYFLKRNDIEAGGKTHKGKSAVAYVPRQRACIIPCAIYLLF